MMTKIFSVALGILTAIGGFVDIGDLVTNTVVGSRFGLALVWVVVVGVIGICLYANMAGRVAAVSGRATFEIIRERLGPRTAAANLAASFFINLMTLTAEIGGVALALQLATDVGPMMWIPVAAFAVWVVVWRVKFSIMENVTGMLGLMLIVFAVSVFALHPNWGDLVHQVAAPAIPDKESAATYWYFAIALFGAAMTPYEVFFFSSGAVEEHWTTKDLGTARLNVIVGFPLGGLLSIAIAACATIVLLPSQIDVTSLSQTVMPVVAAGGQAVSGLRYCRDCCRDVWRRIGDHVVRRLHPGPVPRLAVGQVPPSGRSRAVPCGDDRDDRRGRRGVVYGRRPDHGNRVLGCLLGDRTAIDLPANPDRSQRLWVHGRPHKRES